MILVLALYHISSLDELRVLCCFSICFFCIFDLIFYVSSSNTMQLCSCCIIRFVNFLVNSREFTYSRIVHCVSSNTEFFLVCIFQYSVQIRGNTDQKKLCTGQFSCSALFATSIGLMIPIQPNLHGSAVKLLSSSDIQKSLNKAGINFCLITLCKGNMKFSMFSIVLMMNMNFRL